MNLQQAVQPRSAANGFGRRRIEKDFGPRLESKPQPGKANSSRMASVGEIANTLFTLLIVSVVLISNLHLTQAKREEMKALHVNDWYI